ncbi:unnamed protein product [Ixodes pacificus]
MKGKTVGSRGGRRREGVHAMGGRATLEIGARAVRDEERAGTAAMERVVNDLAEHRTEPALGRNGRNGASPERLGGTEDRATPGGDVVKHQGTDTSLEKPFHMALPRRPTGREYGLGRFPKHPGW